MKLLAPSILSADFSRISKEIKSVESAGADLLHLDVMDGHFVPNITFGPKMVSDINKITDLPLDVHLMISEPEKYISDFASAGADWISVHYEAANTVDLRGAERRGNPTHQRFKRLLSRIKDCGCKAGAVINPGTPVDVLNKFLSIADYILIMSVNPGFGGQKFIQPSIDRSKKLKSKLTNSSVLIEMDGGIGLDNIENVRDAGVDVFVCGNSIFSSRNKRKTIKEMKKIINLDLRGAERRSNPCNQNHK